MKTEINLENKANFFGNYWGQKYMYSNDWGRFSESVGCHHFSTHLPNAVLILKSISSITPNEQGFITSSKITNDTTLIIEDKIGNYFLGDLYITDYLRSKGYALPWMGLSVDQMVEAGWIKLIK